jgi:hypothetical protein
MGKRQEMQDEGRQKEMELDVSLPLPYVTVDDDRCIQPRL